MARHGSLLSMGLDKRVTAAAAARDGTEETEGRPRLRRPEAYAVPPVTRCWQYTILPAAPPLSDAAGGAGPFRGRAISRGLSNGSVKRVRKQARTPFQCYPDEALAEPQQTTTASCDGGRASVSARSCPRIRPAVTEPGRHGGRPSSPTGSSPCRGQGRPGLRTGHSGQGSASGSDLLTTEDTEFHRGLCTCVDAKHPPT